MTWLNYLRKGKHRGEYKPQAGWRAPRPTYGNGSFIWKGKITFPTNINPEIATLVVTPSEGIGTLPILAGPPAPPPVITMEDIENMVIHRNPRAGT